MKNLPKACLSVLTKKHMAAPRGQSLLLRAPALGLHHQLSVERKRETSEVPEATSRVQRISLVFLTSDHPAKVFDLRVSAAMTKQELDVPVTANQDESRDDT